MLKYDQMLKTLPKYFVKELIGPFLFALGVINSVFVLNLLFKQLGKFLSKGIPLKIITEFLFLNLAWMIALSVPMAVLTATIMAFGRLSADNEITAVKAGGIGIHQILPTVLLLSALLAGGLIWFNNHVLPDFNHRARLLAVDIARKKPTIDLEPGVLYTQIPNYSILVQKVEEKDSLAYLENVIVDDQTGATVIKTITAEKGTLYMDPNTGLLEITLFNGETHEVDINKPESFKRLEFSKQIIKISMTETLLRRSESGYRGDREKSAAALMESVVKNRQRVAEREKKLFDMLKKQFSKYSAAGNGSIVSLKTVLQEHKRLKRQIQSELNMINSYKKTSNIYLVEIYKKYSIPAACVVFILIGAPLGIMTRKQGWPLAAGLSIGFFLLYWAFLIGGEILADRRIISPVMAMWSPNMVVGSFGLYLTIRVVREHPFIHFSLPLRRKSNGATQA